MQKLIILVFILGSLSLLWTGCEKDSVTNQQSNSLTDSRDGKTYATVTIGNQTWMAENLCYNATGSWLNPNNPNSKYGRLYDWATVMNGANSSSFNPSGVQGICPNGWHLPSDAEWSVLEIELGMSSGDSIQGGWRGSHGTAMKSTTGWDSSGNGTNSSGFNVLPAGLYGSGNFYGLGSDALFISATEYSSISPWNRSLYSGYVGVSRSATGGTGGYSCRCVKD